MTGSSGPMIASTFWKKTIHGAISCDQLTFFDSSSCSRKLPAVWKNFFGHDRSAERRVCERRPLARVVCSAALEVLAHRRDVEAHDLLAVDPADLSVVVRHELHHATPQMRCATSAYVSAVLHEPVDLEVLAELDVHQARRRPVVEGRDAVARQRRRVAEPARDVALRLASRRPASCASSTAWTSSWPSSISAPGAVT